MLMIILALVGFISGLMSYASYKREMGVICRADEGPSGCKLVYMIPQAWFMGIHFSILAPIYFSIILVLSIVDAIQELPFIDWILWLLYLIGLGFVPYLIYLEVRVARAICMWCTIMHICIIIGAMAATINVF